MGKLRHFLPKLFLIIANNQSVRGNAMSLFLLLVYFVLPSFYIFLRAYIFTLSYPYSPVPCPREVHVVSYIWRTVVATYPFLHAPYSFSSSQLYMLSKLAP